MPLQATSGAASYDAFGGGAVAGPTYVEDVFSTYLYSGNNSYPRQLINGIDLAGKGGLIWSKIRNNAGDHFSVDTATAPSGNNYLQPSLTNALTNSTTYSYNNNGYTFESTNENYGYDGQYNFVSWTFRKQPKFFDIVTWTGDGINNRSISHSLGSTPGCIIVKSTSASNGWCVYHRASGGDFAQLPLNATWAEGLSSTIYPSWVGGPTETTFTVRNGVNNAYGVNYSTNDTGQTYVAYLFAHNAGGFGLTGTDNVISCGSYTGNGSATAGTTVTLGYEPQWLLVKLASAAGENWTLYDTMRGMPVVSTDSALTHPLYPNDVAAELNGYSISPQSTGFRCNSSHVSVNGNGKTYIYIAIRRGPMKVPTSGTSVFDVDLTGNASAPTFTSGFPVDLGWMARRSGGDGWYWVNRLRGGVSVKSIDTTVEASFPTLGKFDFMNGYGSATTFSAYTGWNFRRAPSFMDVVCYTGSGSNTTISHNLGVVPELIFVKRRDTASAWDSYSSALANTEYLVLNTTAAKATGATRWNSTTPTSSVFSVGTSTTTNASAGTYVAHLFATCAGVSKVGTYTGTATLTTIDCGFTGGARFVLIKKISGTSNWFVYDTYRGMVAGTDPSMQLNTEVAESNENSVYTIATGFQLLAEPIADVNTNGATYIFLAIA